MFVFSYYFLVENYVGKKSCPPEIASWHCLPNLITMEKTCQYQMDYGDREGLKKLLLYLYEMLEILQGWQILMMLYCYFLYQPRKHVRLINRQADDRVMPSLPPLLQF